MPTPVSAARQCLTEEAARALDDAVTVARRRSHSQTTSLHAVSALLALPSSTFREACARSRSSSYSPRLQFRALELSVGVSLDRLPTTKAQDEPPISNSLMAAIKRSQANQRRHPETFHLYQQLQHQNSNNINSNSSSISTVKVELKHFILSILDDPIVSRVFGEAGFRSFDIKIAILNPPTISRLHSKTRFPPLFLCNLSDLEVNKRGFSFPFSGALGNDESLDENSRRIGEILVKKIGKNPLLVGVCAHDALIEFKDVVKKCKVGILPREIDGLGVICLEKEISDFVEGGRNEEMMGFKFKEVDDLIKVCKGAGAVVSYGDLKVFVECGEESAEAVNYVVSQLSRLMKVHYGKLWLIGCVASYETYMRLLARFPSIEKDWDLHLVPITSSRSPVGGVYSKSGLMGSFVPFGGFFSTPSDFDNSWNNKNQSTARCNTCNGKYEQEASVVLKGGSTVSVADQYSANLSPWLQVAECNNNKLGMEEAQDDRTVLNARLVALETKWNDICQRLHHNWSFQQKVSQARSQFLKADTFKLVSVRSESSITDSLFDERKLVNPSSCMPSDSQNTSLPKPNILKPIPHKACADSLTESPVQGLKMGKFWNPSYVFRNLSIPIDQTTSSSITSVTTDLGLGTIYAYTEEEPSKPKFQDDIQNSHSVSPDTSSENASNHVTQSSPCSVPWLGEQSNGNDFKYLCRVLSEKVSWQDEAVYAISEVVASCRNGRGRRHNSNKGNIWLSFLGPDKVGKRRISAALAEAIFGSRESFLRVDLDSANMVRCSDTIFDGQDLKNYDLTLRAKTIVDYIAEELGKKSHSVVLLENIEKADVLVQSSLSQAIRTGKFPNSHQREISLNNIIFVITSRVLKGCKDFLSGNLSIEYSEERILAAKDVQMQIQVGCTSGDGVKIKNTNVIIASRKGSSAAFSAGKRKFDDIEPSENKMLQIPKCMCEATRSSFDLNLPVEEMEEDNDCNNSDSDSGSESSKAWLEDFLDQVDRNVTFKPFDFDGLAQNVLNKISVRFQKIAGSNMLLEIESEIVVQILAAAWLSERKKAVEDWIEGVLYKGFEEASHRYNLTPGNVKVMRLIDCGGLLAEDHCPGICLPARLNIS